MALEDPSAAELIRDLQQDFRGMAEDIREIKDGQVAFVTRELNDLRHAALERRVGVLEDRDANRFRILATAFVFPILVGLVVWWLTEGKP